VEKPAFTLGVEEEFQIIDPETRELRSHVQEILDEGKLILKERVKPEMHQSVIEIGTGICRDIQEVRRDVGEMRTEIIRLARNRGMRVAAAGTHPFSNWADQKIFPDPRYDQVVEEMQLLARANLIFGLHVHVGIQDRALAFQIMNEARYFLPHILALSTNSPFWLGRNSGLKSFRTKIFDRFPRTNIPEYFDSPAEFDEFVRILVKTNCIDNGKKIWWDVRPHPFFDTIEFRICDIPMRLDETVTLAALVQAICVKLYRLRLQNLGFRRYRRGLILENKWRASRYGIEGKLIDFGKEAEVPFPELVAEMLEFVDDVVDELGSRREVEAVNWILQNGTGADRQLRVYEAAGGDLRKVVDYICEETAHGLPVETAYRPAASH
jgi:carboxylate-amine ligase